MKKYLLPALLLIAGLSLVAGWCGGSKATQSLKWPPDTITATHVGGNIYEVSSGDSLAPARMRITFTWPMPSDTSKLYSSMAMRPPSPWPPDTPGVTRSLAMVFPHPWPPDTPFYPIRFKLTWDSTINRTMK